MNTSSWIPTRATALPVQQFAALNQLSLSTASGANENRLADPVFLNRLQLPSKGEDTPSKDAPVPIFNLLDSLRGQSPSTLEFEQRPTSLEFNAQEVATEQINSKPDSAQQAMQQFVGETFYGMLMKQMRNTVVQSDLFGNSSAKRMFESQLDQTLVQGLAANHSEFLSQPIRI